VTADQLAQALVQGGSTWLVLSLAAVLPILWSLMLIMHFARPYIIRFLQTLTLRFGGDVWWLSYVLIRDLLMILVLSLGMVFLMPNLYIGLGLPVTGPIAIVILFWALLVKLVRDADDDPIAFRWVSILLVISSVLYIVPQVYGLESADQADRWSSFGLGGLPNALSASGSDGTNPLAWPILWLSYIAFGATATYLFVRFLRGLGKPQATSESSSAAT